jgi:pantoate--beta-alanine ligase
MHVVTEPNEIQLWSAQERCRGKRLALVPTMGFFHEGHLALMRWAREHCDTLLVSLFVNPTQFSPNEDLKAYPRDLQRDSELAEKQGVDVLFIPTPANMFPRDHSTWVEAPSLCRGLCAVQRPTHFRGVATVVAKLFLLCNPTLAVFGEKDWQQLAVIRRMTKDLNLPVEIVGRPTVREPDGLAMSSRNIYLSPEERAQAPGIHQGLQQVNKWVNQGETDAGTLLADLGEMYERTIPLATVEYLALVDPDDLLPLEEIQGPALLAVAVRLGKSRLIDNTLILAQERS